ncbi:unnamed protein product [Effrenium voratum]|nr:unnamed protein product [Effrenium voratum]
MWQVVLMCSHVRGYLHGHCGTIATKVSANVLPGGRSVGAGNSVERRRLPAEDWIVQRRCKVCHLTAAAGTICSARAYQRLRGRLHMQTSKDKESSTSPGRLESLYDLSEEELLEYELADEDFTLCEEEEEEWRQYDEEVQQFKDLMLECCSDATSSSSKPKINCESDLPESGLLDLLVPSQAECLEGLVDVLSFREVSLALEKEGVALNGQSMPSSDYGAPAFDARLTNGRTHSAFPEEYRERVAENEGAGVVVSSQAGGNALVLLNHLPDQPELLPVVSDTFRAQQVKIVRGWLESGTDAFEVSDWKGQPLSSQRTANLEQALLQAIRERAAKQVFVEIDGQVPPLECFLGLPLEGCRPLPVQAARAALNNGPFKVSKAVDLGRALVFHGEIEDHVSTSAALDECKLKLLQATAVEEGYVSSTSKRMDRWECLLAKGTVGPLLLWIPLEDLEQEMDPSIDQRLFFVFTTLITLLCVQNAAPQPGLNPPVGALLLSIIGASEICRSESAKKFGIRLGLPLLFPSPAIGTFGVAARTMSLVPNATASFGVAASALMTGLLASFTLIGLGLLMPQNNESCTWVNTDVFPYALRQLLLAQAQVRSEVCTQPPPGVDVHYVPTTPALAAGAFGLLTAALNCLPIGQLDGASLLPAVRWSWLRETFLPFLAYLLLGVTIFDAPGLFPLVVGFSIFTFGVRPQLAPKPVRRDNVSQPEELANFMTGAVILVAAFLMLMPGSWLQAIAMVVTSLWTLPSLLTELR